MGPTALLPFEGRRAEDFFALKNPTASAGFEPVNLGTKGQHATSRPLKPLSKPLIVSDFEFRGNSHSGSLTLCRGIHEFWFILSTVMV